jgi:type IV secretion system protein VirD4
LLLPQEIKELGRDREILMYEGLRPILAKKNRYFQDRRLRARLLPPPARASPRPALPQTPIADDGGAHASGSEASIEQSIAPSELDQPRQPRPREATTEDLERIDSLTLDDFAVDWSRVEIPDKPEGERLTSEELHRAVDSFLATMRER